jgi:hypothetical protein
MAWINRMEDFLLAVLRDRPARAMTVAVTEATAQALLLLELFWLLQALDLMAPRLYPFMIEARRPRSSTSRFSSSPLQVGVAEKARTPWSSTSGDFCAASRATAARRSRDGHFRSVGCSDVPAVPTQDARHVRRRPRHPRRQDQ